MKQAKCIILLCVALAFLGSCGSSKQYVVVPPEDLGSCGSSKQYVVVPPEEVPPIDEMPEFPGGLKALKVWLGQNIQYPEAAQLAGVQGKVMVSFTVEVDGSISDCKVIQSLCPSCDGEALRVVKSMPRWKPGIYEGQPVRVGFILPISFKIP